MATTATRADVARLFGRAAFGATSADLDTWAGRPYVDAVDSLLAKPTLDILRGTPLAALDPVRSPAASQSLAAAQQWWLEQMRKASNPLEERLTLLWHDHFATGIENPPDVAMMLKQNDTIRAHALGNFRDLVNALNVDPAMLFWLNGTQSSRPVANENYAREFFELFTLGKYPQVYGERDVREAARAFTGWVATATTNAATFNANRHDTGKKTVLGQAFSDLGDQEHVNVTRIALEQAIAPRFIAYKLVRGLAYDPGNTDLLRSPDPLVVRVADVLSKTNWDLRAAVRELLVSDEFRYASGAHEVVREPVEVIVAAYKALGMNASTALASNSAQRMGQRLFDPPSVGGWPVGTTWLSPTSIVARYDFAIALFAAWTGQTPKPTVPASADLAAWTALLGLAALSDNTASSVRAYLASRKAAAEAELQPGVFALLLTSPDWMVI